MINTSKKIKTSLHEKLSKLAVTLAMLLGITATLKLQSNVSLSDSGWLIGSITLLTYVIAIVLSFLILKRVKTIYSFKKKVPWKWLDLVKDVVFSTLVAGSVFTTQLLSGGGNVFETSDMSKLIIGTYPKQVLIFILIFGLVLEPILQEILFRGILPRFYADNQILNYVLSFVLFAGVSVGVPLSINTATLFVGTGLTSVLITLGTNRTHNLIESTIIHSLGNLVSLFPILMVIF